MTDWRFKLGFYGMLVILALGTIALSYTR